MPNETILTNSDKISVLKFISETNRKIHEERIKREFQVVITTLSFYAASVAFKIRYSRDNDDIFSYAVCVAFIFIAIFVYKYLKTSGESNEFNQRLAEESENILLKCLSDSNMNNLSNFLNELLRKMKDPDKFIEDHQKKKRKGHPSANRCLWQAIIVISGSSISIVLFDCLKIGIIFYIISMSLLTIRLFKSNFKL